MKKCSICGESISEFSDVCPYCHSNLNEDTSDNYEHKRQKIKQNTKIKAIVIAHVVVTLFVFFVLNPILEALSILLSLTLSLIIIKHNSL